MEHVKTVGRFAAFVNSEGEITLMDTKTLLRLCDSKLAEFNAFSDSVLPQLQMRVTLLEEITRDIDDKMEGLMNAKPRSTAPAYFTGAKDASDVAENLLKAARETLEKYHRVFIAISGVTEETEETE